MSRIQHGSSGVKAPIWFRGKKIGELDGRTARFFVGERHWYRAGNGYSLDEGILESLEGEIDVIEFSRRGCRERIPLAVFLQHSWATKDYGVGRKLVCDCRYYDGRRPEPRPQMPRGPSPDSQPMLFVLPAPSQAIGQGPYV